jgi:hypothetical protein
MPSAISNTSPLLYLYRIGALGFLPRLFDEVWTAGAVVNELGEGRWRGYVVPDAGDYSWLKQVEPKAVPSEWLVLDLGPGEIAVMSLALENPDRVLIIDDGLARRVAQAAGLVVWGTLKVLLEAKSQDMVDQLGPLI